MKKLLVMALLAMSAFGFAGAAHAGDHECTGAVDANCNILNADGSVAQECTVYTSLTDPATCL